MDIRLYLVGGTVRDELLGHRPNDVDYAVEAPSFAVMRQHVLDAGHTIFTENDRFCTLKARCEETKVVADYTLCRKESFYSDGHRPDTVEPAKLHDDLARRDFTINAIAKTMDGTYIDPFGGIEDLKRGVIRCVGSTHDRLFEAPFRALRALRFSITKGFTIDDEIMCVMQTDDFIEAVKQSPQPLIHAELRKMFSHNTLEAMKLISGLRLELQQAFFAGGLWLMPTTKKT